MVRRIEVGAVAARVFRIYRDHAGVLLPVAAIVFLIQVLFSLLVSDALSFGLASIIGFILSTLYQGMVVELVSDIQDGRRDQSVNGLLGSVSTVLGTLLLVGLVHAIGVFIGLILLIVPGLILLTLWAVSAPVVVVERTGVFQALSRSQDLVRGNGWPVFGVIVLFYVIEFVALNVLNAIGSDLGSGGQAVLAYVGSVLTAPLVAVAAAVLYFDLRAAHEPPAGPEPDVLHHVRPGAPPSS